jgi:MFS family permease
VKIRDTAPTSRVMLVAVMVSMVAFLDSTVVNLALPATTRDLGGGMGLQQWVVDGYLLALGAMILPGGSISDLLGRVPVMRFGLVAFGVGSVLAATAPAPAILITAGVVQGLGAAFLMPGSLAMINDAFDSVHQSAAVWRVDRMDRHCVRVGSAARRASRGPAQLAVDLCALGHPHGHRFRLDVLDVPHAGTV